VVDFTTLRVKGVLGANAVTDAAMAKMVLRALTAKRIVKEKKDVFSEHQNKSQYERNKIFDSLK